MLKYFRVALPKRFMNKKQGQKLLSTAASVKIKPGKVAVWQAEFDKLQVFILMLTLLTLR